MVCSYRIAYFLDRLMSYLYGYKTINGGVGMLISEFIQQLQDLCDNEGDMEIVIVTGNNGLGSIPHVKKSPVYDQFEITKY